MKEQWMYFIETVWPEIIRARGLSESAEPSLEDFKDWCADLVDMESDRDR